MRYHPDENDDREPRTEVDVAIEHLESIELRPEVLERIAACPCAICTWVADADAVGYPDVEGVPV